MVVSVQRKLRVSILVTGNEFAKNAADLKGGKIYESNGQMLKALFQNYGIEAHYQVATDDLAGMTEMVAEEKKKADLLIMTGGVSVGDYDFTRPALEANGYATVFHKVNQKPGKPLLFSACGEQVAFGLPGNPRAGLMCCYQYVLPWLLASMGTTAAVGT